jgi:hypothetical protein
MTLGGLSYSGVREYVKVGGDEFITLEASSPKRKLTFQSISSDPITVEVSLPSIIMLVLASSTAIEETRVFLTKYPLVNKDSKLYHWPFGNVYDSACLCWGGIKEVTYENRFNLLNIFLESAFNSDLGFRYAGIQRNDINVLIDHLRKEDVNILNFLMPYKGLSYSSVHKEFLNEKEQEE